MILITRLMSSKTTLKTNGNNLFLVDKVALQVALSVFPKLVMYVEQCTNIAILWVLSSQPRGPKDPELFSSKQGKSSCRFAQYLAYGPNFKIATIWSKARFSRKSGWP